MSCTANIRELLQLLEDLIWSRFISALTDRPPANVKVLLCLPGRPGGIGLSDLAGCSQVNNDAFAKVEAPLRQVMQNPREFI